MKKPPLPVAALCRQVRRLSQDLGEPAPSYSVVYDIVSKLPADLVTLAHQGSKAYSDAFELVHRREADGPNAIWQADHTPLDILLVRPIASPPNRGSLPLSMTSVAPWRATFFHLKTPLPHTPPWRSGRASGERKIPAGSFAASQMSYTPITGATSLHTIWSRSVQTSKSG